MKNWLLTIGLNFLWLAAGRLGKDLAKWIAEASTQGLEGRKAFDYVWVQARAEYKDIGNWLLNLLIEVGVGKQAQQSLSGIKKKLKWPKKLTPSFLR